MWSDNSGNPQGSPPPFPNAGNYAPYSASPAYGQTQPGQSFGQSIPAPRGWVPSSINQAAPILIVFTLRPNHQNRLNPPPQVPTNNYPGTNQPWSAYPGQQSGNYALPQGTPGAQLGSYAHPAAPPGGYAPPSGPPGHYAPPGALPSNYGPPPGPPAGYAPPPVPPRNYPPSGTPGGYAPPHGGPSQYNTQPGQPSPYAPPPGAPSRNYGYSSQSGPPAMPPTQQQFYGPQFQGPNHQMQQSSFQYSQCTGKKKALCIGINYRNQSGQLAGCINDANNVKAFLMSHFGYKEENIVILTDDSRDPRRNPTKQNIMDAMRWLVSNPQPNDSFFFHYSGHGGQTKDQNGDEADGYDEVIYPVDFQTAGHIVDDLMYDLMVRPLPQGCRLTAIFDSCHSGSALDLPYVYSTEGKVKEPNLAAEAGMNVLSAVTSYARRDMGGMFRSVSGLVKTATGGSQKADRHAKATKTSPADCISFSGCKDSQTSADTQAAGRATGAMSFAFVQALKGNPRQSYQQLLVNIRDILRKGGYGQKPQLSSSHPMDTNILFIA
ncbi:hypothetical protein ID866_3423 [Astraeus odoratus]|nr:hypothetical protein ID866_3423 [Astraeus odoratus]